MIQYNRVVKQESYLSPMIKELYDSVTSFFELSEEVRAQERFEDAKYDGTLMVASVAKTFYNRCVYCDRITSKKSDRLINAFRPQSGAIDKKGIEHLEYYYWLRYEADNLYLSCKECAKYKGKYFPVIGPRAKVKTPIERIYKIEKPVLIDVCQDDPEKHIYYDRRGNIKGRTSRGRYTIEQLNLNRRSLIAERITVKNGFLGRLKTFSAVVKTKDRQKIEEHYLKHISAVLTTDAPYSFIGFRRWLFNDWFKKGPHKTNRQLKKLGQKYLSRRLVKARTKTKKTEASTITKLRIENFRNIDLLEIDISEKQKDDLAPWLFILGENGSGKSSILQSVALGLIGKGLRKDLLSEDAATLVRRSQSENCKVKLFFDSGSPITYSIAPDGSIRGSIRGLGVPVLGYGATRLMTDDTSNCKEVTQRGYSIGNLFDPKVWLTNANCWLNSLPGGTKNNSGESPFDKAAVTIKRVLHLEDVYNSSKVKVDPSIFGKITKGPRGTDEIYFQRGNADKVPIRQLSDGYKIIFALTCDIMKHLRDYYKQDRGYDTMKGVVFIDEIGNHLHPRWKKRIVASLRKAFKNVQFFVTSHEPLCLRGIFENEVQVIRYDYATQLVSMVSNLPDPTTYRIDQLLMSPFFGLSSTIDPEDEVDFIRYYNLLSIQRKDLTKEQAAELEKLKEITHKKNHFSNSLREELVYHIVDKLIATRKETNNDFDLLLEEAFEHSNEFWDQSESEIIDWINNNADLI